MNKKIAFYIMNSKGYFVLKKFIKEFGVKNIGYVVSGNDSNIKKDYFDEIQKLSLKHKIKFFNRFDDFLSFESNFKGHKFGIGWRWLIKNELNLIVFHDSLLPKYRGFAPLVNTLINGDKMGGVTALFASNQYDRGDIISQKSFEINYPIKIEYLIKQTQPLYYDLVKDISTKILNSEQLEATEQNDAEATYSLWLDNEDYFIDWSWSAKKIKRFVDAVSYPYDNAKAYLNGDVIKFIDVEVFKDVHVEHRDRHIGKVIFIENGYPAVVCKKGLLKLIDITDENDKELSINFRSRFE